MKRASVLIVLSFGAFACRGNNTGAAVTDADCRRIYDTFISICGAEEGVNQVWGDETAGQIGLRYQAECSETINNPTYARFLAACTTQYRTLFDCGLASYQQAGTAICSDATVPSVCVAESNALEACLRAVGSDASADTGGDNDVVVVEPRASLLGRWETTTTSNIEGGTLVSERTINFEGSANGGSYTETSSDRFTGPSELCAESTVLGQWTLVGNQLTLRNGAGNINFYEDCLSAITDSQSLSPDPLTGTVQVSGNTATFTVGEETIVWRR